MPAALSVDLRCRVVAALGKACRVRKWLSGSASARQRQALACPTEHARFGGGGPRWAGIVVPLASRSTLLFCSTTSRRRPTCPWPSLNGRLSRRGIKTSLSAITRCSHVMA